MFFCFFFFQAEDGIRDLVRSRGLGDVYKRQGVSEISEALNVDAIVTFSASTLFSFVSCCTLPSIFSVSYTHLTLPTSDLV